MLGASAGSLRKAPGLSSYRPPRDKPGAGPTRQQAAHPRGQTRSAGNGRAYHNDGDAGFFGDLDLRLLRRPRLKRPETCLDLRALRFEERRE